MKKSKKSFKREIFDIIQIGSRSDIPSRFFDYFIVIMICISIGVTFLQTFKELDAYKNILNRIEFFTIIVFIIEYALRIWTSDLLFPRSKNAVFKFVFSFYGIIDLLTIVSYFAPLYSNGIIALRMIRVTRIMRLFRVNTQSDAFGIIAEVLAEKRKQLVSSIFMIVMIMLGASLCMYGFEHDAQPDVFENAFSGMWWAMSTILTVGYGDIYPITVGGRIVGMIIAILGVCVVAIPTGVISAGFVDHYQQYRKKMSLYNIQINPEIGRILREQANRENLDADTYVEKLILEKMKK